MSDRNTVNSSFIDAASRTNKLDKETIECRENSSERNMQKCDERFSVQWDKQLNENYKTLMKSLPEDGGNLLRDAERKWIDFDNADLSLGKYMRDDAGRSFQKEDLIADRAKQLADRFGVNPTDDGPRDLASVEANLNTAYKQVKDLLNPEQQAALTRSERKWISFKDAEYKLIDHLFPPTKDADSSLKNNLAKAQILDDRNKEIRVLATNIDARH